jgi:PTH1 family peptidyl-tRNA hydrolase
MSIGPNYLIAGLGNPGNKYSHTRHNIGFKAIDSMAHHYSIPLFNHDDIEYGIGTIANRKILLVKPQTFMNRSGQPIYRLAQKYRIIEEKMIIIHDDLDLVFGRLKIKWKGGSGGHKGICSLIDVMGRKNFIRIRIGIGRPENDQSIMDFILGVFTSDETVALNRIITRVREAIKTILCQGLQEAMNSFNNKRLKTSS